MSFYTKHIAQIGKIITPLSYELKCLYILLTCEKMLPNYISFSKEVNWGDVDVFYDVLKTLEDTSLGKHFSKQVLEKLNEKVEENVPDLDEFETGSFAFDASLVFNEAVLFLLKKEPQNIENVLQGALDSVDMFVQMKEDLDPNDVQLDEKIEKDVYMQRECNRQIVILQHLITKSQFSYDTISEIRKINENYGNLVDIFLLENY